jgi:hypothetical protein
VRSFPCGHFIAVLGRTNEGNYIVSDPMYGGGAVEMTRDELKEFFPEGSQHLPTFVPIGNNPTE